MGNISQLTYNEEIDRLDLAGDSIHCGEVISVLLVDQKGKPVWVDARFEYSSSWYMIYNNGQKEVRLPYQVNGLFAKRIIR